MQTLSFAAEIDPPVTARTWFVDGKPAAAAWPLELGKNRVTVVSSGRTSNRNKSSFELCTKLMLASRAAGP